MEHRFKEWLKRKDRIRSALLVIGAAALFVFGLLLLLAPAPAPDPQPCSESCFRQIHFLCGDNGRIIGSQSRKPISLAGG
jgi:hypothetical protein